LLDTTYRLYSDYNSTPPAIVDCGVYHPGMLYNQYLSISVAFLVNYRFDNSFAENAGAFYLTASVPILLPPV
jgi:hypothetical protein